MLHAYQRCKEDRKLGSHTTGHFSAGAVAGALALPMLAACGQVTVTTSETEGQEAAAEPTKLRIGDLPLIDMLPVYVAEQEGLFPDNLEVELVPFSSALEARYCLHLEAG